MFPDPKNQAAVRHCACLLRQTQPLPLVPSRPSTPPPPMLALDLRSRQQPPPSSPPTRPDQCPQLPLRLPLRPPRPSTTPTRVACSTSPRERQPRHPTTASAFSFARRAAPPARTPAALNPLPSRRDPDEIQLSPLLSPPATFDHRPGQPAASEHAHVNLQHFLSPSPFRSSDLFNHLLPCPTSGESATARRRLPPSASPDPAASHQQPRADPLGHLHKPAETHEILRSNSSPTIAVVHHLNRRHLQPPLRALTAHQSSASTPYNHHDLLLEIRSTSLRRPPRPHPPSSSSPSLESAAFAALHHQRHRLHDNLRPASLPSPLLPPPPPRCDLAASPPPRRHCPSSPSSRQRPLGLARRLVLLRQPRRSSSSSPSPSRSTLLLPCPLCPLSTATGRPSLPLPAATTLTSRARARIDTSRSVNPHCP